MTKFRLFITIILTLFIGSVSDAQVILNEISNKNSGQIYDEDNELEDWIEIYNPSSSTINLANYCLSDDSLNFEKWAFPSYQMPAGKHLVVFASGKDRKAVSDGYHWESPVLPNHTFDYLIPGASTPANWKDRSYLTSGWRQGKAGFGYGDNDDASIVPDGTLAIYVRKAFTLPYGFNFQDVSLMLDYDDGFVAYLNGTEIARMYMDVNPAWNSTSNAGHEATMYSGGKPEAIAVNPDLIRSLLVSGTNVLSIEVHNTNSSSADLSLIPYFSFKINDLYSLFDQTPATLIPASSSNLHANFKIDSKGENISLFNKKTNKVETVLVKNLTTGLSMGRVSNGSGNLGIFLQPTPNLANTTKSYSIDREPQPVFSISEGFYTDKKNVSITSTSSTAEIRYTKDGSEPVSTSTLYNGTPIPVSVSVIIRATCFSKANKLPSFSASNTYFMNKSGHSVPVLSVITDNSNLYGGTGIFDHTDQEWERPCYVEYFNKEGKKQFEQFSGIQIDGGAGGSRSNPQHSFRLEFNNKTYGEGDVDYPLITDRHERNDYKSIYLRNGSNQWLTFQFKDAMQCEMMANKTNNYYSHCTPTVVYINGSYFGVYEMREKLNDEYFQENYKATIDSSFQLLSLSFYYNLVLRALNGSVETFTTDYNRFLQLKNTDFDYLKKVDQILDLEYYTDYIIAQSWIADTDWPYNNIKIVKGDFTNNRWRFILQDLEWALSPNGWSNSRFDHINYMITYDLNMPYLRFWRELIKNAAYKKTFINRFADIMNSSYLPENTTKIAQEVYDASFPEMSAEYTRWGGDYSQYSKNLAIFKTELTNRSTTVRKNIVSNFTLAGQYTVELQVQPENAGVIQTNTIFPEVYPWSGVYFAGVPIKMEAKGLGNYVFDGWVANSFIKDTKNPVIEADVKVNGYKFVAKFRLQTPADAITISEINYSSDEVYPAGDWIELYNYGQTAKDLTGWYLTDSDKTHKWVIPGAVFLQAGESLVLASDQSKFSFVYPNVKNVLGSFGFRLGSPTDSVQIFDRKDQLIAGVKYSNLSPWPTGAYDQGMTLELKDPNLNLNLASNWFDGCVGGSPGAAYTKCLINGISTPAEGSIAVLYPNPASDLIYIVLPSVSDNQDISCRIYDVMGKEVKTETVSEDSKNTIQIEVSGFRSGIYVVKLSGDNFQQSLKFVKN